MDNEKKHDENVEQEENIDEQLEEIDAEIVDEDGNVEEELPNDDDNEYKEKYQRLLADFTNFKKREEKARTDFKKFASSNLIEELLPVLDNFDRALKDQDSEDSFVKGIMMTRDSFWKVLEKEGLEEIESDGVEFDPNFHHAFQTEENEDFKSNYIIETYQKGYKLNDRVIRPSMVKVAK
ncbi:MULTISPECIES: nucleotide exchange factor GrpE [Anaerococcus]|uniref:nucleotide exchange factor GrpE n=1 Tax=Anaerococcus TaxID=165779 RepID=UPI0008A1A912|nr:MULTISPECIES: nucleotide exchange factor GrpE [Anaerococcus]MBS6921022.1 nucleotide exchange factor GrpE [Anaerococcus vaginalis]MDU1707359.1 nucleotide exchange factor GrpE [Anaerococcus vaginalis]MDU1763747.1 nucleotide exchange factor GrpE [Anaerococcus vaginalis]MDU5988152.1 nucleotide exchange factor GrpE [Anaerococcus vaginalis]OFO41953.1 nucleotide exchange factor GrpE [Anaerococcus sp. HMSC075B03]